MILGRLEGGRRTRRTSTTDNTPKIFILMPIAQGILSFKYETEKNTTRISKVSIPCYHRFFIPVSIPFWSD